MSRPEFDHYREFHENVPRHELLLTFGDDEEGDLSDFEQWARYEEDLEDAYLQQNKT